MAIAVASITPTVLATRQTTHPVDLPATVNAGDWLVAAITLENNPAITTPSGWTLLFSDVTAGSAAGNRLAGYARIADGSEGGTSVNFVADATSRGAAHVYRVTGAYNDISTGCVAATPVTGIVSTSANPPGVTASWTGEENLYIAFASASDDNESFTSAPTNYTGLTSTGSGVADNNDSTLGSAYRLLTADSDDPDSFGLDSTGNCITCTIVIRPAASGGSPYTLAMDGGTATMVGQSLGLTAARVLTMSGGTAAMAGQPVGMLAARLITMGHGSLTMVGQAVDLTYTPSGGGADYTLAMGGATASMAGQIVGLSVSRKLSLDGGALAMTGQAVGLYRGYPLVMSGGAAAMQGQPLDFSYTRRLIMEGATLAMVGQPVGLIRLGDEIVGTLSLSAFYQTSIELTAIYDVVFDSNGSIQ